MFVNPWTHFSRFYYSKVCLHSPLHTTWVKKVMNGVMRICKTEKLAWFNLYCRLYLIYYNEWRERVTKQLYVAKMSVLVWGDILGRTHIDQTSDVLTKGDIRITHNRRALCVDAYLEEARSLKCMIADYPSGLGPWPHINRKQLWL